MLKLIIVVINPYSLLHSVLLFVVYLLLNYTLVYVIVWLAVVFEIISASNAGGKTVLVRGKAERYYSFPACIMRTINSKYYN